MRHLHTVYETTIALFACSEGDNVMMTSTLAANVSDVTGDEPIAVAGADTWSGRQDDGRPYLHDHWLRYRDVIDSAPDWFIYALGVYITIVGVVSIVGNATVIVVFIR